MEFKDYFSRQSEIYSKARPTYPDELFEYLSSLAPAHNLCWDCATGNGQAAVSLSKYFKMVVATDASESQIKNAGARYNIEYKVAAAEESGLAPGSVDLITVATAAHWFNLDKFYAEAKRVAKPGGVLAVWTYSMASITPEIDELMEWFAYTYLLDYWPDGRWHVRNHYKTLDFPFEQVATPKFFCHVQWNREQWLNYVKSWSSYNNYTKQKNLDPLEVLLPKLNPLWQDNGIKNVSWPLHLKCAKL